jgi:hypothetical protein
MAGINFASFYLSDEANKPEITFYNLLFNKGKILQFPSNTRTTLLTKKGKLSHKKIKAYGTILINKQTFTWSGSHVKSPKTDIIAYGLFDIQLEKHTTNELTRRQVHKDSNSIICSKNHLLLGCTLNKKVASIKTINSHKLDLTKHVFILKGHKNKLKHLKIGDKINKFNANNHIFSTKENACSASFLLSKTKDKLIKNLKEELFYPKGEIPKPLKKNYLKSWSVILKEKNSIIFFINDARPKHKDQVGISVLELQKILKQKFNFSWAVVGDSGQSSKLLLNHKTKQVFGNLHYLNYKTDPPSWDGIKGRSIPIAILAYE